MKGLLSDLRFGARSLRRQPLFTTIAVATLALGMGANTAMFTLVNGVLLTALPIPDPDRVVVVQEVSPRRGPTAASAANYADWRDRADVFESIGMRAFWAPTLLGVDDPRPLSGARVSQSFLDVLGITPTLGRAFRPEEERPGAAPVALLSHGFWQEAFAGDADVLGRTIRLSDGVRTVVGVLPPELERVGIGASVYAPVVLEEGDWLQFRGRHNIFVLARLRLDASLTLAQGRMSDLAARLAEEHPETNEGYGVALVTLEDAVIGAADRPLLMLWGAVGLVLLIGCVNLANLSLARAVARRAEIATYAALGAPRWMLLRRLMVEAFIIAVAGGVLGFAAAASLTDAIRAFVPSTVPRVSEIGVDWRVAAFAILVSCSTVLAFALLPALRATRPDLHAALVTGAGRTAAGGGRVGAALVTLEFAMAMVLLVGAGLFLRSLGALTAVDVGLRTGGTLTATVGFAQADYSDGAAVERALDDILGEAARIPGAVQVAATSHLPLSRRSMTTGFGIQGGEAAGANGPQGAFRIVTPDYFDVMGITLLMGRAFASEDARDAPQVVLVNETLAGRYWPEGDAVGSRITFLSDEDGNDVWSEVIGVVADVRHMGPASAPLPEIYQVSTQADETWRWVGRAPTLVVRLEGPSGDAAPGIRAAVRRVDPNAPVYSVRSFDDVLEGNFRGPRFHSLLLTMFAIAALVLSAIGIYGVLSFNVGRRTREIGVRMALGAARPGLVTSVVLSGLRPAVVGILLGAVGAYALSGFVESLLFGISRADPGTYAVVPAMLGAIAALACWLPARRAASIDPIRALRDE